ncbi:MAG: hypothetical protein ACI35S_06765 [Anaeroplasma sp.]
MKNIEEYPYFGEIYRTEVDMSKLPSEQQEVKTLIYSTKCDIMFYKTITEDSVAMYKVYLPIKRGEIIFRIGDIFSGNMMGVLISGRITSLSFSQLGGCCVRILSNYINNEYE